MQKRIVYVVNVDWFFVSHRLPLALKAVEMGWNVFLVTKNTGKFDELRNQGIQCISLDFERSGKNPIKEISLIVSLRSIYKEINPDIIHHVTLKPSIYGTIAAKQLGIKRIVNAVSGLGYSFTDNRKSISKVILMNLLKWAFKNKASNFIFQNPDDMAFYKELGFLTKDNFTIIKGSGVDEEAFKYCMPKVCNKLNITLLSRMLKDKGVLEFIAAANALKTDFEALIEFTLVGGIDQDNPAHIKEADLKLQCDGIYIKWLGHRNNVKDIYERADIVCLPSYREGLPKSLVEAMAIGRPIITTDAIGCRECVDNEVNGFLIPVKDSLSLAKKMKQLILNKELRLEMGLASRKKMINEMSLATVVSQTFDFYEG